MKSSLPSTLLVFLATLTSASPIPSTRSSSTAIPPDCAGTSCDSARTHLVNNPSPPQTDGTSKQRSHHSVQSLDHLKITISITDSSSTSSKDTPPTVKLTSEQPVSSKYLQSLPPKTKHHKQKSPETIDLEQKVSHYLSTHPASPSTQSPSKSPSRTTSQRPKKNCKPQTIYLPGNVYITSHHYISRNPDIAVIGIVLLFLLSILAIECAERVVRCARRRSNSRSRRQGEGDIYLDDENSAIMFLDVERGLTTVHEESERDWEVVSNGERDAVEFKGFVKA